MKLALISLDGLDPRIIYDNRDKLPNFDKFMEQSQHGIMKTPGHTIPSYIQTLTGLPYHETNFYWDVTNGGFGRHRQLQRDYLWDIVDSSMTLLNIPVLYPPEDINDAMICGVLAPEAVNTKNIARPMEVQKLLNSIGYVPSIDADSTYNELGEQMEKYCINVMEKRYEATELLVDEYDSDLFYGVWTMTDRWFHQCAMYGHDYMPLYKKSDEILGKLIDNVIPNDIPVMFFSDHGFAHFSGDNGGVNKGHMYDAWYSIRCENIPSFRNDMVNIADIFPTTVNYLDGEIPDYVKGRILFHKEEQDEQVKDRLRDLGYME